MAWSRQRILGLALSGRNVQTAGISLEPRLLNDTVTYRDSDNAVDWTISIQDRCAMRNNKVQRVDGCWSRVARLKVDPGRVERHPYCSPDGLRMSIWGAFV